MQMRSLSLFLVPAAATPFIHEPPSLSLSLYGWLSIVLD